MQKKKKVLDFLDGASDIFLPRTKEYSRRMLSEGMSDESREIAAKPKSLKGSLEFLGQRAKDDFLNPEAMGVAGELASYLVPVGKAVKGASWLKNATRLAKAGATSAAINTATDPKAQSTSDRVKNTLTSAVLGGTVSGGMSVAGSTLKGSVGKLSGDANAVLKRVFKITPSQRADFRKATGGTDFEELVIERDLETIKGMDHSQMLEYFGTKASDAYNKVDGFLSKFNKTVDKQDVVDIINAKAKNLSPESGNVLQGEAINGLKKVLSDLQQAPDQLDLVTFNSIKRQLQEAGDAALSANSKPTATSKAMADISTKVKNLLEAKAPGVEDLNKDVQYYSMAKRAIEKVGDREVNKSSNDLLQKTFQSIPLMAGIGTGLITQSPEAALAVGGVSMAGNVLREKYLTPQFQTKLASLLSKTPNPEAVAKKLTDKMVQLVGRQSTMGLSSNPADNESQSNQTEPLEASSYFDHNDQSIPDESTTSEEVFVITNSETGETKEVPMSQLGDYGLGEESIPDDLMGLPSEEDIITTMVEDLETTGGKNVSKLNTLLQSVERLNKAKGGGDQEYTQAQAKNIMLANSGLNGLSKMEEELGYVVGEDGKASITNKNLLRMNVIPGKFFTRSFDAAAFRAVDAILRMRSGAAVPEEEVRRYMNNIIPRAGDSIETIQYKMDTLEKELKEALELSGKIVPDTVMSQPEFSSGEAVFDY